MSSPDRSSVSAGAQQGTAEAVRIDNDDISGVVTGKGPEAGVWVIAETNSLPTKFSKTVVTDDRGRYLVQGAALVIDHFFDGGGQWDHGPLGRVTETGSGNRQ